MEKTIQTIMGKLTFSRGYHIAKEIKEEIYRLDQILGSNLVVKTGQILIDKIIDNISDNS
jgi:hypothetical protein